MSSACLNQSLAISAFTCSAPPVAQVRIVQDIFLGNLGVRFKPGESFSFCLPDLHFLEQMLTLGETRLLMELGLLQFCYVPRA